MRRKTVVIVTKDIESRGGVANYFRVFFCKYHDELIEIENFDVGSRSVDYYVSKHEKTRYLLKYIRDMVRLIKLLLDNVDRSVVQVNPSLIPVPLIRDGLVFIIAKTLGRKVVVFFHGWDEHVVEVIDQHQVLRLLFMAIFSRADQTVVLANRFKDTLLRWGIPRDSISVSRTMFDGDLVVPYRVKRNKITHFLFLSRISEIKGVFDIIEAAAILKVNGLVFRITFAGYGRDIDTVDRLKYLSKERAVLDLCSFKGYLDGKDKFKKYSMADVFLLPSYQEGCPNSVLEAMASGLFLISTDVGALGEIVKDGVNGKIVKARDPKDLGSKMKWAIDNIEKVRKMGENNIAYAFQNFEAAVITTQIKDIYKKVLTDNKGIT